jgi:hypothetical protein
MLRLATALVGASLCALAGLPAAGRPPAFPLPKTLGPVETYGANIQRSMTLMATSTPLKRNTVRILFYGQSITEQDWSFVLGERLRRQYPLADLVIENRAIGGYTAGYLERTAEADLYPFYPDLVIFHVYGEHHQYENVIRRIRERTTADILHTTDHIAPILGESVDEETDPAKLTAEKDRIPWMNHAFLPALSRKYRTELADVRGLWKQYLKDHRLPPRALVKDGLHLSPQGEYLMAELVGAHLRHRPDLPDTEWADRVKTLAVGTDVHWRNGKLVVPFDGNRVDLVCGEGKGPPAAVRIDGRKPSEFPELYVPTRVLTARGRGQTPWLLQVKAERPRVLEDWTLTATATCPECTHFKFAVAGSVTGPDGEGESGKPFVSRSGRVAFDALDLNTLLLTKELQLLGRTTFQLRWKVVPQFADQFAVPAERNPFGETAVTVAQGLANGRHTLELTGSPDTAVAAVRVYRPPLSTSGK